VFAAPIAAQTALDPLAAVDSASPQQMWLALHELRLRQIELEVQNEELRRLQLAVEAARNRYADLYNAAPVGYLVVGENATIIEANQSAGRLLGRDCRELLGQRLTCSIVGEDQDCYYLLKKRIDKHGGVQTCKLRVTRPDGGTACIQLLASAGEDHGSRQLRIAMHECEPAVAAEPPDAGPGANDELHLAALDTGRSCFRCGLRSSCLPHGLNAEELAELDRHVENIRPLAARQMLVRSNDVMRSLYLVRSGALKSTMTREDGTRQIIALHLPGELICPESLYHLRYRCEVEALQRSQLCAVPHERLRELAGRFPALQAQLMHMMTREMVHDHDHLVAMSQRTASQRVVLFLRSLSQRRMRQRLDPDELQLPMTRADIGNFLNLAEETVCRTLTRLQRDGVLTITGKKIRIRDQATLSRLCHESGEPEVGASV
jgi:CRP/FNR family transcriptional regulator